MKLLNVKEDGWKVNPGDLQGFWKQVENAMELLTDRALILASLADCKACGHVWERADAAALFVDMSRLAKDLQDVKNEFLCQAWAVENLKAALEREAAKG